MNWPTLRFGNRCGRLGLGLLLLAASLSVWGAQNVRPVRIGLPHVLMDRQYLLVADWRQYLQNRLHRPVEFVIRRKDSDTTDQLRLQNLDFAWISEYSYVHLKRRVRLVAVPLYQGRPSFRSYLIVPAADDQTTSLLQLKRMVFAYVDPYSTGGYLDPRHELWKAGEDERQFFSKTFFTWSNRSVVEAVAQGLAAGGAVDGFVWDSLAKTHPDLTGQTRVVAQSLEYGAAPVIANRSISADDFSALQRVLLGMARDPEGGALLKRLNLDGFVPGNAKLYARTAEMMKSMGEE
jgi:phosphonate transport system substrate-binding protein